MLETYFIFRQQKIEFKPMSGVIMLLCNRMLCWIFGEFFPLPLSPLLVFPSSSFFHIPYPWTLFMNLIHEPYRWTLLVNLIHESNFLIISEPYSWTLLPVFQLPGFHYFRFPPLPGFFQLPVFSTSGFPPLPFFYNFRFFTTSVFSHFRFFTISGSDLNQK